MTQEELNQLIDQAAWFGRLGEYQSVEGQQAIRSLEAWRNEEVEVDRYHQRIAEQMEWLPAQSSEPDPIHGQPLEGECKQLALAAYKRSLNSLQTAPANPRLQAGPHDFRHVAEGAASYAARMAAAEICARRPAFWSELMRLYHAGHWPCGRLPDGTLIVF